MLTDVLSVIVEIARSMYKVVPATIAIGIVFTVLSAYWACNKDVPWYRKPGLITDLVYWFIVPVFARFARIGMLVIGAALFFGIHGEEALIAFYDDGHGPLATLPLAAQVVIYLVASDFMLYWTHRLFHGGGFWKYHAVHHSSVHLEWISAARFHPVNLFLGTVAVDVVLLLSGISPNVLIWAGPINIVHSAFVHANLNWSLGPFRYVLATPIFHRWHHTTLDRGGNMNFAGSFPVWDILFGTWYWPAHELPDSYGLDEPDMPESFGGQLVYPFRVPVAKPAEA